MASLISGYEYDIFISYRQKDNKHDGWVTEFVNHLKGELESTFKEEISVYFDINHHDELPETHDADTSLNEKLKCLIFIPVISRTYCDPGSFVWEHEFKAFIEQALPHISAMMSNSIEEVVQSSDVIVVSHNLQGGEEQLASLLKPNQLLIDLVKIESVQSHPFACECEGICW